MSVSDLKVYGMNSLAMAFSFTHVESTLKLILLVVSIGYTVAKWADLRIERKKKGN